jgi:hypothetical protein
MANRAVEWREELRRRRAGTARRRELERLQRAADRRRQERLDEEERKASIWHLDLVRGLR